MAIWNKHILFVHDKGQMCNNIIQYSHVYAWTREHNVCTISLRFAYKYQYFRICHTFWHNIVTHTIVKGLARMHIRFYDLFAKYRNDIVRPSPSMPPSRNMCSTSSRNGSRTRTMQFRHLPFQLTFVASVLMFTVLFSTGSESSTYIIAFVGVALWYWMAPWSRSRWDIALMIFAFILTSMSPSDLFPAYIRKTWVQPYALKALPIVLIWLQLTWELCRRDYEEVARSSSNV